MLGSIYISISNPKDTGIYSFSVLATESISGKTNNEVRFKLTLTCTITAFFNTKKNIKNVNYVISAAQDQRPVIMSLPVYAT